MSENAHPGFGVLLYRGDDANPQGFEIVGEIGDLSGPNLKRNILDGTDQQSPGGFMEKIAGLGDGGELSSTINFRPESRSHYNLVQDLRGGQPRNFRVSYPVTGKWGFKLRGIVVELNTKAQIKDKLTADLKIAVTGKPDFVEDVTA